MQQSSSLRKKILYGLVVLVVLIVSTLVATYSISTPRNDRDWTLDQQVLSTVEFNDDTVTVRDIRNFGYRTVFDYIPNYYDKTFNLTELESVDFIVEPLSTFGIAHTFVSFGFKNGDYVSISVEIRKEKGEKFSPLKGLVDQFELMYVIADERDLMKLRALHRKDVLYLYPIITSKEKMRAFFVSMLTRAESLREIPEFYNTLLSTCTTNIADHINQISENRVPWDVRILLPLDSDEYAYELGLIDTSLPFLETRIKHQINTYVERYADDPDFSQKIREHLVTSVAVTEDASQELIMTQPEIPQPTQVENAPQESKPREVPKSTIPEMSIPLPPNPETRTSGTAFSATAMLAAHNTVRTDDGVAPLLWSSTIAKSAQAWGDTLQAKECIMQHDANTQYGENIFLSWSTGASGNGLISAPTDATTWWAAEKINYNYAQNTCKSGEVCGHYTQMVWGDTTEVGCGVSSCFEGNKQTDVWVCRYDPPGNFVDEQPF